MSGYNKTIVAGKRQIIWYLRLALGFVLFIGLLPMVSMSMQPRHMLFSRGAGLSYARATAGHAAPTPCCSDTVNSYFLTCGTLVPQFGCATHLAGTQPVARSPLLAVITYRETGTPPPKA